MVEIEKFPKLYKHFKGNTYVTLGRAVPIMVTEDTNIDMDRYDNFYIVQHTEDESRTIMAFRVKGESALYEYGAVDDKDEPLIVYRDVYNEDKPIWARPIESFYDAAPEGSCQKNRFEEIK